MIWWWRNRVGTTHCVVLTLVIAAIPLTGDRGFPVPSLAGGSNVNVQVILLLPLASAVALAVAIQRASVLEAVATRRVAWLDRTMIALLALVGLSVASVVQAAGLADSAFAAGRNLAGYLGLTLVAAWLAGPRLAGVLPVGCTLLAASVGVGDGGRPRVWAWPIAPADSGPALVLALGTLGVGLVAGLVPRGGRTAE